MSFTRQDARNALDHILSIFDHDDDELTNALEIVKCTTIFDLVSMPQMSLMAFIIVPILKMGRYLMFKSHSALKHALR